MNQPKLTRRSFASSSCLAADGEERPDILLTMNEAAAALRMSRRWLQDFIKTIPPCYLQAGRKKLFDSRAMTTIRAAMRRKASKDTKNLTQTNDVAGISSDWFSLISDLTIQQAILSFVERGQDELSH